MLQIISTTFCDCDTTNESTNPSRSHPSLPCKITNALNEITHSQVTGIGLYVRGMMCANLSRLNKTNYTITIAHKLDTEVEIKMKKLKTYKYFLATLFWAFLAYAQTAQINGCTLPCLKLSLISDCISVTVLMSLDSSKLINSSGSTWLEAAITPIQLLFTSSNEKRAFLEKYK